MTRRLIAATVLILCAALTAPARAADLTSAVRNLARDHKLGNASVGVYAVDLATGQTLVNLGGDDEFIPASNMKLLTSGAALLTLGPDFVFRTEVLKRGDRLIVRGGGDPALADPVVLEQMDPPMTVEDLLDRIVGAVRRSDTVRIDEIVLDDRVFDRERVHPDWPRDQLNRRYCAEVDGLTFHNNVLAVFPRPSPAGEGYAPSAPFQPEADWVEFEIRARTVTSGDNTPWIIREPNRNRFTLLGDVRHAAKAPVHVTLTEPALFFGRVLADRLAGAGVRLPPRTTGDNPFPFVRLAEPDEDLSGATPLAVVTTSMPHVLRRCNTDSYNLYAECLIKSIGHALTHEPGSWENGAAGIKMLIAERLGPSFAASAHLADGSGMSRENKISPRLMVSWLSMMQGDQNAADAYLASLPHPGEGTLRTRFIRAKPVNTVQAKSGLLSEVRTLSGYITHEQTGHRIAFSILVNELDEGVNTRDARDFHEAVVLALDSWLTNTAALEAPLEAAVDPAGG